MLPILTTTALFALVLAAAGTDLRSRRIPNALTLAGLVLGLATRVPLGGDAVLAGVLGAGLMLLLALPFFAIRALGGGDVKLLVAVGAFTGLEGLVATLLAIGVAGGVLALVQAARQRVLLQVFRNVGFLLVQMVTFARYRIKPTLTTPGVATVPYGVAIAAGVIIGRLL